MRTKLFTWCFSVLIMGSFVMPELARSAEVTTPPDQASARWQPPPREEPSSKPSKYQSPRVRIGLRLTSFQKVVTQNPQGISETRFIPMEPLRHTLRARLDKTNHFFIGEWHIETSPQRWVRKSGRYDVRINIYRRFGAFGQLEENVGHTVLAGVLSAQQDNIHILYGVARERLRDKFGNPVVDIVAGFTPGSEDKRASLEARPSPQSRAPAVAPADSAAPLIRGRF